MTFDGTTLLNAGSGFKGITLAPSTNNSATLRLRNSQANYTVSNITGGSFSIADGNSTRFTIDSNGTVGINDDLEVDGSIGVGIANPSQKIHINGGNLLISNSTQSGSSAPQIRLNSSSSDGSSTRFMLGLATGSNNFINGAVANDACVTAPQEIKFGATQHPQNYTLKRSSM